MKGSEKEVSAFVCLGMRLEVEALVVGPLTAPPPDLPCWQLQKADIDLVVCIKPSQALSDFEVYTAKEVVEGTEPTIIICVGEPTKN